MFFCVRSPSTISSNIIVICVSHFKNGEWDQPQMASFSGKYRDFDPCISPDGSKIFFISDRPGDNKKNRDGNIWMVEKMGDGWSEPKNIGEPVNTKGWELGCSAANDGTLYFSTTVFSGGTDLYRSEFKNGKYQKTESLGDSVNSIYNETDPAEDKNINYAHALNKNNCFFNFPFIVSRAGNLLEKEFWKNLIPFASPVISRE
jgi:hypothetical protein